MDLGTPGAFLCDFVLGMLRAGQELLGRRGVCAFLMEEKYYREILCCT